MRKNTKTSLYSRIILDQSVTYRSPILRKRSANSSGSSYCITHSDSKPTRSWLDSKMPYPHPPNAFMPGGSASRMASRRGLYAPQKMAGSSSNGYWLKSALVCIGPAPPRIAPCPGKMSQEKEQKAMQAGPELSGGLGVTYLKVLKMP